jgi:NADH-quinone oxidoreductase subunit J
MPEPAFVAVAAVTILTAVLALEARDLVYGAVGLGVSFLGIAGFFVLLEAPYVAVFQVIVYVGAIAVLILFTVMLVRREKWLARRGGIERTVGIAGALAVIITIMYLAFQSGLGELFPPDIEFIRPPDPSFVQIGVQLVGQFWPILWLLGLTLAAAVLGALALVKLERGER